MNRPSNRLLALPLATCIAASMFSTSVHALTNDKTCARVQQEFAQTGRVTTRTRSGATLPIYGGVPFAVREIVRCGPNQTAHKQFVISSDKRRCPISQRCV